MSVFRFPCSHNASITHTTTFDYLNPPSKASGIGLPASKVIYTRLVTAHFGELFYWTVPVHELLVILVLMFVSVAIAVYRPSKRIRSMAVTDTINEL